MTLLSQDQALFLLILVSRLQFPEAHMVIQTSPSHPPVGTKGHPTL